MAGSIDGLVGAHALENRQPAVMQGVGQRGWWHRARAMSLPSYQMMKPSRSAMDMIGVSRRTVSQNADFIGIGPVKSPGHERSSLEALENVTVAAVIERAADDSADRRRDRRRVALQSARRASRIPANRSSSLRARGPGGNGLAFPADGAGGRLPMDQNGRHHLSAFLPSPASWGFRSRALDADSSDAVWLTPGKSRPAKVSIAAR